MRIAINTRLLIPDKLDGMGRFIGEIFVRLAQAHPQHQFLFIFDRHGHPVFPNLPNIIPIVVQPVTRHPLLWHIWLQYTLPYVLKKHRPDIFISPDGFLPLNLSIPTINVIHDINFEHFPEDLPGLTGWFYRYFFPKFAQKADLLLTVSHFSKDDLIKTYQIHPDKIDVVYNGISSVFVNNNDDVSEIATPPFGDNAPYFLFVGSLSPRKNVERLLLAFDKYKKTYNLPMKLVIVGAKLFKTHAVFKTFKSLSHAKDVIFAGRVSDGELAQIYKNANALIYVSYFEGFGLPVVEAMAAGIPVVASKQTAMPEIAGRAAIYADASQVDEIAQAMHRISTDQTLRDNLLKAAVVQLQQFSWDKSAQKMWQMIRRVQKIRESDSKVKPTD